MLRLNFVKHFLKCLGSALRFLLKPSLLGLRLVFEVVLITQIFGRLIDIFLCKSISVNLNLSLAVTLRLFGLV